MPIYQKCFMVKAGFILLMLCSVNNVYAWPLLKKTLAQKDPSPLSHDVRNLAYGQALYHYFLDGTIDALTLLEVDKVRQKEKSDILTYPFPDMFNMNLSLQMGLSRKASHQLDHFSTLELPTSIKDQVYFYLAKYNYERGNFDQTSSALSNIQTPNQHPFNGEIKYFSAQIAIREKALSEAETIAATIPETSPWRPYIFYNIALAKGAHHTVEETDKAWQDFKQEASQLRRREKKNTHLQNEIAALEARAAITEMLLFLQRGNHKQSIQNNKQWQTLRTALDRIRLDGPWSNSALLSVGLHAHQDKKQDIARKVFLHLQNGAKESIEKQTAMLLLPKTYLSSHQDTNQSNISAALNAYNKAINHYKHHIETSKYQLTHFDQWYQSWIETLSDQKIEEFPTNHFPTHDTQWALWLAKQKNQQLMQEFLHVQSIETQISKWKKIIPYFLLTLDNRTLAHKNRLASFSQDQVSTPYQRSALKYAQLSEQLNEIISKESYWKLADQKTQALYQLIEENKIRVNQLERYNLIDAVEADKAKETLRKSTGLLIWQLELERPVITWQAKKNLNMIQRELNQAKTRLTNIQALSAGLAQIEEQQAQVNEIANRILAIKPKLVLLKNTIQDRLRESIQAELQQQIERQKYYLSIATYERARIADRMWQAESSIQSNRYGE